MTTMLILIVLKLGAIQGIFLGDFDSLKACQEAANVAAVELSVSPVIADAGVAGLMCVARPEA